MVFPANALDKGNVLKAGRGDIGHLGPFVFQQRIGGHRGAVNQLLHGGQWDLSLGQRIEQRFGGLARGRKDLTQMNFTSAFVQSDQVGKSAAGVNADAKG